MSVTRAHRELPRQRRVAPNNLSNIVTRNINVQVNVAPVLANIESAPPAYTEGNPLTLVTSTLTIADADSPNPAAATVQPTSGCEYRGDVLTAATGGGISGSYNPACASSRSWAVSEAALYQTALRSVRYPTPATTCRPPRQRGLPGRRRRARRTTCPTSLRARSTSPPPTTPGGHRRRNGELHREKAPPSVDGRRRHGHRSRQREPRATGADHGNCASAEDAWVRQPGRHHRQLRGIDVHGPRVPATVATYQTALRSVTYNNTSNNPSTASRTVAWIVNDGHCRAPRPTARSPSRGRQRRAPRLP